MGGFLTYSLALLSVSSMTAFADDPVTVVNTNDHRILLQASGCELLNEQAKAIAQWNKKYFDAHHLAPKMPSCSVSDKIATVDVDRKSTRLNSSH